MAHEPWLDCCSEDWISEPRSSLNSLPNGTPDKTRRLSNSGLQHQSRIPLAAPRSSLLPPNIHTRQSLISSLLNQTEDEPSSIKQSQINGNSSVASNTSAGSPSNDSNGASDNGTMQVKPCRGLARGDTPEWKRRVVRGEISAGDQCDLFGPLGLENVFKPPPTEPRPGFQGFTKQTRLSSKLPNNAMDPSGLIFGTGPRSDLHKPATKESPFSQSIRNSSPSPNYNCTGLSRDDTTRLRSVSGREELRNEDISPIFLTRNNTIRSQMDYAPLDEALGHLEARLGKSPLKDERGRSCGASDDGVYYDQDDQAEQSMPNDNILEMTCQSLPEDLSMGTQDFGSNSAVANLRRGGYSNEASFQRQGLSPLSVPSHLLSSAYLFDSHIPSSPPLPEYSQDSEVVLLAAPTPPQAPKTPRRSHTRSAQSPAIEKVSSGSPLKLFGNHDTFTNNKLLRRMSQFEETLPSDSDKEFQSPSESQKRGSRDLNPQKYENKQYIPGKGSQPEPVAGEGRTGFKNDATKHNVETGSVNAATENSSPSDTLEESYEVSNSLPPLSSFLSTPNKTANRTHSRHDTRPVLSAKHTSAGTRECRQTQRTGASQKRSYAQNQDSLINISDAKRLLNTPARDSTPKRRRTLQRVAPSTMHNDHSGLTAKSNAALSFVTGQGQNSTQQGLEKESLLTDISKLPQEGRPRTPSPCRRQSSRYQNHVQNSQNDPSRINRNNTSHGQRTTSNDLFILGHTATGVRKGSITTQDFLDEATKIMSIIRAKGRPKSALASVDESNMESPGDSDYGSIEESSSQEEFSRPPSREGVDIRKARVQPKQNPRIVSHLRKYQEKDDFDLLMSASIMSLHLGPGSKSAEKEGGIDQIQDEVEIIESSPKNIRIRENIFHLRERKQTRKSNGDDRDFASMDTRSSRSSSARSIPTGSSNSSGNKGMISSNMISHLIPEQVGGMTYDRMNHTWVKGHGDEDTNKTRSKSHLGSSEADPFENITDLSVDELQELMKAQKLRTRSSSDTAPIETGMHTRPEKDEKPATSQQLSNSRPQTRDGNPPIPLDTSSVHSKVSHFNFSGPKIETRATSWGTDDLGPKLVQQSQAIPDAYTVSGLESLGQPPGVLSDTPRRANGPEKQSTVDSITAPSPPILRTAYEDDSILWQQRRSSDADSVSRYNNKFAGYDHQSARNSHNPVVNTLPRRPSLDGRTFIGRPISRIDEQNEESLNQDLSVVQRNNHVSTVSIPSQNNELSIALSPDPIPDESYSFHLTTLADFTVNQIDQPLQLELSYIARRTNPTSLRQVHGTFALATEELVKHITDVEPYEPYWDHIQQLDLHGKGLITLHQLSEFCPRLEELDVSNNAIGQLSGVPSTIRNINIQQNYLSSLTAWSHLSNLQYVDVSGNDLESLDGFSSLVHLRELKANDNKIENINGIFGLSGLLSLRLKGNPLASVDFEAAELVRLTDVDLSDNHLSSVKNFHLLTALEKLDLSGNNLQTLSLPAPHRTLHSLKLSNNHMQDLDLRVFPALQLLYLDQNHFSHLSGLENCRYLEIFSAREQVRLPSSRAELLPEHVLDIDISSAFALRKLYLSSNILSARTLSSPSTSPNLQLLDLASCAIKTLPAHFGTRFPNLRALNLNFNALSDVGELLGISRLGRLALVGNRVARLRRLCQVLNRVGGRDGSLKKIDLRGNPITVGFYPPAISGSGRTIPKQTKKIENGQDRGRGDDGVLAIANLGHCADIAYQGAGVVDRVGNRNGGRGPKGDIDANEIDDPYTLPVADVEADKKYITHLDEGTRLRRKVVELMISSATAGRVKLLDGLPLICDGGSGNDCDSDLMLRKLKELQIFREGKREAVEEEEL